MKLPEPENVGALMFQRTLCTAKMREEYVGRMHFAMSSYEQMDIFHFGIDNKRMILLVTAATRTTSTSLCQK